MGPSDHGHDGAVGKRETSRRMSLDALVATFRDALIALIPAFDRVGLPWRNGAAYDQWDAVAEALYRGVVADALAAVVYPATMQPLATYAMAQDDHGRSRLRVSVGGRDVGVFFDFWTLARPLDSVRVVEHPPAAPVIAGLLEDCSFAAELVLADGSVRRVTEVTLVD